MAQEGAYTLHEAHREFAKLSHGRVWQLLEKPTRSADESIEMAAAAYASLYHWTHVGTEVHRQRGEWLLARVHTVLGEDDLALRHARRCLELTEQHKEQMEDFDLAFAYEGMARALALAGEIKEAAKFLDMAQMAGEAITNSEDQALFMGDLRGGEWYGLA
ncbi:MAG: hypothetical protein PVJ07_00465 [Anaerolineales bacterium]|jgi:hypothetical protein